MNIIKQFNTTPITFNDDGWFNATDAAKAFDKEPFEWLRLSSTVEYIAAVEESKPGKSRIALVATKRGGKPGA